MTPPLNHHHSGAGLFRKEQDPNSGCLGYVLMPLAVVVILIVAAALAYAEWRACKDSRMSSNSGKG